MAEKRSICLINDSFPPVIDGVANAVTNYASVIQRDYGDATVVTPYYPDADDSAYPFPVLRYPSFDTRKKLGYVSGRPAIGIDGETLPATYRIYYRLPEGIYVTRVYASSDAAAKGISEGDIITAVNGNPASATSDILTVKNTLSVGDTITFTIWRDGETFDVDVTLVDENDLK